MDFNKSSLRKMSIFTRPRHIDSARRKGCLADRGLKPNIGARLNQPHSYRHFLHPLLTIVLEKHMGKFFEVKKVSEIGGVVELCLSFGVASENPQIIPDAIEAIRALNLSGGTLVKMNGPSSVPVGMALAHEVAHLFAAVACFDPKINSYVVCISNDPQFQLGQQL